jgi:hypothetical protein
MSHVKTRRPAQPTDSTTQRIIRMKLINPNPAAIAMMNFPVRICDVVSRYPPSITASPPKKAVIHNKKRMISIMRKKGASARIECTRRYTRTIV